MAPSSVVVFFFFFSLTVTSTATHNRRALHQPFFPKYPSSSYSSSSSHPTFGAFFPLEPSPPHPPPASSSAAAFPTFPVNVSSTADASSTSPSRRSPSSLLPAVATPLLAVAFLLLSFVLFLHFRRRQGGGADNDLGSDSVRLFPPRAASSGEQEISAAATSSAASHGGSDLLFVAVAGSSHRDTSESCASGGFNWKLRSPELRPLPPLPRHVPLSGEACRSSSTSDEEICPVNTSPPPPPPKPTSLLRPPTPSPPKRRPPAHSPPSSPLEAESDEKVGTLQYSPRKNLRSPRKIGDFARSALVGEQIPPPPAPVPAAGSHEGQNVNIPTFRLPLLAPPRDSLLKKTVISRENENPSAAEMNEENLGPKLKRLHSDKSQATPEHAMVLDHLKSGSSQ